MRFFSVACGLIALATPLIATPAVRGEVLEQLRAIPQGWTQGAAPPASKLMKFRIAVHVETASEFEQAVIDMSTPDHPSYGNHMSKEEVKAFLRPSSDVSAAVLSWLESEQVPSENIDDDGDWISFIVPVAQAERMLDAHFYSFSHVQTGVSAIRTLQYSIPATLHGLIDMIQPTTRFGTFRPQKSIVKDVVHDVDMAGYTGGYNATFCNTTITPDCLRGLYGLGNYTASPYSSNKLGISGYLEELARYSDLALFKTNYAPYLTANFSVVSINNGTTDQTATTSDSVEANLDTQYAMALGANTKTTFYSTGGTAPLIPDLDQPDAADSGNEPYLEQLAYLLSLPTSQLPKVLTNSYGEDEQSVPASYTSRACNMFAQLGSRGVSIIFSSGDTGVGSACQTNDGKNTTRFLPIWPAACPFVTSVGGTYRVEPERAISFSSGGFSDRFSRPAYQEMAVNAYLDKLGSQWEGLYNPNGRGFPDVAAQSNAFAVYDSGKLVKVGGTSASAPTFAGIITALNSVRISQGKRPLGFLNPWIYSGGYKGLTDITVGGSDGCTGEDEYSGLPTPDVPYASWNATTGWDPVTGYGTPDFPALISVMP